MDFRGARGAAWSEGERRPSPPRRWPLLHPPLLRRRHLRLSLAAPPVRYLQIVLGRCLQLFVVEWAGGADDVFQDEVEAAFGFTEGAIVIG